MVPSRDQPSTAAREPRGRLARVLASPRFPLPGRAVLIGVARVAAPFPATVLRSALAGPGTELAPKLSQGLGQQVVIANRPGAGVTTLHVPYKGGGPSVIALVSGEVSAGFATMPSVIAHVKARKLRGIAVTTAQRSAASGLEVLTGTPPEYAAFTRSEVAKWSKIVKAAKLRVD